MEVPDNSSPTPGIKNRVCYLLLREMSGSPAPSPGVAGVNVFQAGPFWKSNVCGAVVAGIGATVLLTIIGIVLLWQSDGWVGRLWGAGMIMFAIIATGALLRGNVADIYPYAVEIEVGKGFRFYAPFKSLYIPTQEVRGINWSWLWGGWVVTLRRRRGLLRGFVIHFAWGHQGRELAEAIEQELARAS